MYCSPGFGSGANIFSAFSSDGTLVGFAPLLPELVTDSQPDGSHIIWAEIKVDPAADEAEPLREALLGCVLDRSTDLVKRLPRGPTQVIIQSDPNETSIIEFLTGAGFVHTESVFHMQRDLGAPIAAVLAPPGMKSVPWRMKSAAEQQLYVDSRNLCFPENRLSLEDWLYFLQSPLWEVGACLAVFDDDELAGSITLFWDEARNRVSGRSVGSTEFLFVLPRWRGLGLGKYLIAQGLSYLKKHGLTEAQLEVRAANIGALGLYTQMGYQVNRESWFLVNTL